MADDKIEKAEETNSVLSEDELEKVSGGVSHEASVHVQGVHAQGVHAQGVHAQGGKAEFFKS